MKTFKGIGAQLVLSFVVAICVSIILVSLGSLNKTRTAINGNTKVTSEQTLEAAQEGFTTYLKTLSQPVDLLTRKNEIKHLEDRGDIDTNVTAIKDSLVASVKVTNGAELAFFTTKTGLRVDGWTEINPDTGKTSNKGGLTRDVNDTNQSWYKACIGSKARNSIYSVFSDPYKDSKSGKTIFTVSQEIKYTDNSNYGAVGLNIDFSEVEDYVRNIGLLDTGYVLLVNKEGKILVNNDKNTYVDDVTKLECWNTIKGLGDDKLDTTFSFDEKVNGESLHIVTSKDAVTGWTLMGFISESETQTIVDSIRNRTMLLSIIGIIIGVAIALITARSISKELKKINTAMGKMADGDLTHRIEVKRKDEFGQVEKNYNDMADQIAGLIKGVEEKSGVLIDASKKISQVSESTTETVNQVSEAIQSVSIGASGQAESTQKATSEVELLASKLHETKAYVSDINDMSVETKTLSDKGITIVDDLIDKGEKSKDNSRFSKNVVNEMIESIEKINFISDAITEITEQTNLLSLNASIEAARAGESGRGFAVVADQVRQLSSNTAESAEDIVKYVNELKGDIEVLATSMEETTMKLSEGNEKVEVSLRDIEHMNDQMTAINDSVERIFDDIDRQSETTREFTDQVGNIADTYGMLTKECTDTGIHIFKIGRYIDTCRSDMFREAGAVTTQDMLRIFEIDHFILMWRVYNNVVDFEKLKITQLNNPDTCKIGKWMHAQTDPRITGSSQFKQLDSSHRLIHKYACESWQAKEEGDVDKSLEAFQKCYDAYYVYKKAIADMKNFMKSIGYTDETKIVIFRN